MPAKKFPLICDGEDCYENPVCSISDERGSRGRFCDACADKELAAIAEEEKFAAEFEKRISS